ncbi:MAG: CheR family methyltransferase [Bryobacteraceae bacterium]
MSSLTQEAIEPANYRLLQELVYAGSGIVLDQDKHYLFESRLASVARRHGLATVNDLCALIRAQKGTPVQTQVVEAMTTNETYFFREPAHYDAIRRTLLPELKELRKATRKLSFWSSAASGGQEAYSLAMTLAADGLADWNIQILGTDLAAHVLERARSGRYQQIEVNRGLPTPLLLKYFERKGLEWELRPGIRQMARFESFDLRRPMRSLGPFDLVFCRNVLVYLDLATRRKILEEIHGTLFRGGWLLLGTAEVTPPGLDHLYERRLLGAAAYYIAR